MKKKKIEKTLEKILQNKKKPLFGRSRSFSNRASQRKFSFNYQKFTINKKKYHLPVKIFRNY
jgi:hypothetical protein